MRLNTTVKAVLSVLPVLILTVSCSKKPLLPPEEEAPMATPEAQPEAPMEESMYADTQEQQIEALRMNNVVKFNFDKYDILPEFAQILDAHAILLRDNPSYKVLIEGHADERGTPEYNIALGERRANAVAMYLQGNGVSQKQITIVSYGQERPIDLGHGPEAHAKNRRAVLVY